LEKLKQPEFMECVAQILKKAPHAHFKWTGYYYDHEVANFFEKHGLASRHTYIPWMTNAALLGEIKKSDFILACFPLSLGSVEMMAAHHGVPVISLYDNEFNLYWRDIYWEAEQGNPVLREICMDASGNSKILIAKTPEEYIDAALRVMRDDTLAKTYADVYRRSYDYAYIHNPNDISGMITEFVDGLYATEKNDYAVA